MPLPNAKRPEADLPRNGYPDRWVKIEMPGGLSCIITDGTYRRLVANMGEMARCLEKAEFLEEPKQEPLKLASTRYWWKRLFL